MNNLAKAGMLTIALGAVIRIGRCPTPQLVVYGSAANAPGRCQAFTPGLSNTIRNRVVGSENIGPPIAVACAISKTGVSECVDQCHRGRHVVQQQRHHRSDHRELHHAQRLAGRDWRGPGEQDGQSSPPAPSRRSSTTADDMPDPDADLGFNIVGVNCTLPTSAVINDTYVYWGDEDGVEAP